MNIFIRTDSSVLFGSGHVMRCLTLADALHEKGAEISFICREFPGSLCDFIENKGYKVFRLQDSGLFPDQFTREHSVENGNKVDWQSDMNETQSILLRLEKVIDWLIVDHYGLDSRWETNLRPHVKKIMVIDDLANRPHDCDLLLDQNLVENMANRYDVLVPINCKKLLGPEFVLLRPEFREARSNLRERDGKIRRILVFFGGADPTNETQNALEAIKTLNRPDIAVDVVVGLSNPHKDQIKQRCKALTKTRYHCQVNNMAQLMSEADLAIGAGGTTTWERCCLGLPAFVIAIAENQAETVKYLQKIGAIYYFGESFKNIFEMLIFMNKILNEKSIIIQSSNICLSVVDGRGCERLTRHF